MNEQIVFGSMSPQHQVLCFTLAQELYGIPILKVREIQARLAITPIPHAPPFMLGVANLRGAIVPVLNLRTRFGLEAPTEDSRPVIIVVEVEGRTLGMKVDGVAEVLDLPPETIKPAPEWSGSRNFAREFIRGLAMIQDENSHEQMLILLDLDRLLSMEELSTLEKVQI